MIRIMIRLLGEKKGTALQSKPMEIMLTFLDGYLASSESRESVVW